jgi:threonine/homoserine/homoserine lactone efflux protein
MTGIELTTAVLVLLLTPGPTNSLMLLAGAERGLTGALRLIPTELAGYLLTVVPLALVGTTILADHRGLQTGLTLAAGLWVAVLAVKLWRLPEAGNGVHGVDARALFVTTALNPKALLFGLVLLPSPERLGANLVLFAVLVAVVAVLWAGVGAFLRKGADQPRAIFLMRRLASVWLATISLVLIAKGVGA